MATAVLAGAAARGARAADGEVIRYAGDAAFAPFESLDAQGRPIGFQVDLLTELGPLLGVRFDIRLQAWDQAERAFRGGEAELVAMVDTASRRQWARFLRSHATPALGLYYRAGEPEPQGLPDEPEQPIAVLDGDAMRGTVRREPEGGARRLLWVPDAAQALAAVQQGRAGLALVPRAYADPVLAAGGAPGVVASRHDLLLQPYAFAVAPADTALQMRLQQALDTLERNGRLEALRVKWLSSHRAMAEAAQLQRGLDLQRDWLWGLGAAATAGLGLLGLALRRRGQRMALAERQRQVAETSLDQARALLERAFVQAPDPMLVIDRDEGQVRDANPALLTLLGLAAPQLIGQPVQVLRRHVDGEVLQQLVRSLDDDGALHAVPLRVSGAGGQWHDCLVTAEALSLGGGRQVFCVLRDITEQLARDEALRRGYDDLAERLAQARRDQEAARQGQQRAEAALHDFTRTVVHDLRAPLNAVRGFAGLLRERLLAGHVAEALECGEHIDRAAQRMTAMVGALARLAEVSRQPLRRRSVDMQRLAAGTWELLAGPDSERRSQVVINPLPPAEADPDLAAQVWQNLLDNAYKYSAMSTPPRVAVDSFRDDRGTWYRIADNGVGFDMSQAHGLFQPFQRMSTASRFEGTGVGLSLVRRIVDHHGGDIRVRSALGVGTVVEYTLDPLPPDA